MDSSVRDMKKWDHSYTTKRYSRSGSKSNEYSRQQSGYSPMKPVMHTQDDKKGTEQNKVKTSEDKLSTLKSYRRAKGLCFKCGGKWGHGHKCPPTVSLHAMEEVWQFLAEGDSDQHVSESDDQDSGEELMAISIQAL